jgi:SNF2 family DNA or RNA helicase
MTLRLGDDQEFGADFLRTRRVAGLFDGPGYGKSAQFVRAIDYSGFKSVTILCPPNVEAALVGQYLQWSVLGLPVYHVKKSSQDIPMYGVRVLNYALACRPDVVKKLRKVGCDALILDEAHHLKNPSGARTKAVFSAKGIAKSAERIWFVTGTPTPNNASEYFVFAKVSGAWQGTYNQFVERFCTTLETEYGTRVVGTKDENRAELLAMLAPHAIARQEIEDGRGALNVDSLLVDGAAPDYSEIEPEALEMISAAIEAGDWKTLDGPAIATVRRITGIAKAPGVADLVRAAIDAGHRQTLVFCEHTSVIDILAAELAEYGCAVIDGRTAPTTKERVIADFEPNNPNPQFRVAIIQRMALKEGRTMTGATRVILAEPSWTPDDNKQMIARASRRGQKKPVHATFARIAGSIDDAVIRVNQRKAADIAQLSLEYFCELSDEFRKS